MVFTYVYSYITPQYYISHLIGLIIILHRRTERRSQIGEDERNGEIRLLAPRERGRGGYRRMDAGYAAGEEEDGWIHRQKGAGWMDTGTKIQSNTIHTYSVHQLISLLGEQ